VDVHEVYDAREHGLTGDGTTNDQPAFAALVDRLGTAYAKDGRPRVIYAPPGDYLMRDAASVWRSGVSLIGAGMALTRFRLENPGARGTPTPLAWFTTAQHGAGRDNFLADCTFASFEVDGSGMELYEYDPLAKGLGLQYVLCGRFRDLYVHDTPATGFGCDFLQDTVVDAVMTERCGRLDTGEEPGGAGIGIGIGGWGTTERLTVTSCTARGNGTNGIFLELQKEYWPPTRGIRITACHVEDNRFGISDWGADGLVVTGCTMIGNHEAGFDISAQGTSAVAGRGGMVVNCVIDANLRDGVAIGNTPGPYTITGSRISANGRYGYWHHGVGKGGYSGPAIDLLLEGNAIRDNGLDGIRVDAGLDHSAFPRNRIRNNGRRAAPATAGGGARGLVRRVHAHRRDRRLAAGRSPWQARHGGGGGGGGALQHRHHPGPGAAPAGGRDGVAARPAGRRQRLPLARFPASAAGDHARRPGRRPGPRRQPDLGRPGGALADPRHVDHRAGLGSHRPRTGQRGGRRHLTAEPGAGAGTARTIGDGADNGVPPSQPPEGAPPWNS
jgi:Right handed beta helix region/Pectate lyase superfamily protein